MTINQRLLLLLLRTVLLLAFVATASISVSAQVWTVSAFDPQGDGRDDVLALIRKEKMSKPVIVAERKPGSVVAMELALEHPDQIGGVALVGTNLMQFFASPKDPTRKTSVTLPERVKLVDEGWAAKWFKYVTPEIWNSGDMLPEWFSSEVARAQQAWQEFEAAPLPVKIRYLCEFWASDVTLCLDRLRVPVLAFFPNLNEEFLAVPSNAFAKTAFVDSWEPLVSKYSNHGPNIGFSFLELESKPMDAEQRLFEAAWKQ